MVLNQPKFCGERVYMMTDYSFLSLVKPYNQWTLPWWIELWTTNNELEGTYPVDFIVKLKNFDVNPAIVTFFVTIIKVENVLPYFSPKLPSQVTV